MSKWVAQRSQPALEASLFNGTILEEKAPSRTLLTCYLMFKYARKNCLLCNSRKLQPLFALSEEGVLHGEPDHKYAFSYDSFCVCTKCGHGQLERYSHDCFSPYEDEDWNMYWWYVISPPDALRLKVLLANCPDTRNPKCDCSTHRQLRESEKLGWVIQRHAISPEEKAGFAWLTIEERGAHVTLKLDSRQR